MKSTFPPCTGGICDGGGITFTQSNEQAGYPDADNVAICPACGPVRFAGYDVLHAARILAKRLLLDTPDADLDDQRRAWTQVVACYGDDPDVPDTVGIRFDLAEASMFGHENAKRGFYTEAVGPVIVPRWSSPVDAMLELGNAVRVIIDTGGEGEVDLRITSLAQTILDASNFIESRIAALRPGNDAAAEEEMLRASGMFEVLVDVARRYTRLIDGDLSCALQGLAENLEDEFGKV